MSLHTLAPTPSRRAVALAGRRASPPAPSERPRLVSTRGPVVPMRRRSALSVGGLAGRRSAGGHQLVSAVDLDGVAWWIAADAVWSDVDAPTGPSRPHGVGLATSDSHERSVLSGLSDRLGWEAVLAFEGGSDLPILDRPSGSHAVAVLDGRLRHDVPTVVVLGDEAVRWGAGASWDEAMHRALYGSRRHGESSEELRRIAAALAASDLSIATVDLGTETLRRSGVFRRSVQLIAGSDEAGRAWDAVRLD